MTDSVPSVTGKQRRLANLAPQIKPGKTLNPGGKPVGARNRLTVRFLNDLANDFDEHGKKAIVACREGRPHAYLMVVAALLPKEINVTRPLDGLSDDELHAVAETIRSQIAASEDRQRDLSAIVAEAIGPIPALPQAN